MPCGALSKAICSAPWPGLIWVAIMRRRPRTGTAASRRYGSDREPPRVRLEPLFGIEAGANADRNEGAKRAMNLCAPFDPLLPRLRPGGREASVSSKAAASNFGVCNEVSNQHGLMYRCR